MLYPAPDDPAPFVELTRKLSAAFPDHPPYGGRFAGNRPHLTIGAAHQVELLREAERALLEAPSVAGRATQLVLMVQDRGGRWRTRYRWRLGGTR